MKTWEKIMLYPIGLYIWLTDGIKKMSKKWKPAMAMLMAVVMLCGMLPATAIASTNDDEADLLERLGVEGEVQLAELDGGKYIAVYLDDDDSRDSYNNQAAYYAIYDGIWQRPYILEDDGTKDYMPTISDLGNGQLFIAWGTASKTFDANTKEYAALNATDIVGVFVDKATGNISQVLEVTYETEDDVYGDENPRAAYDEATGRLMIWYNKCEYSDGSDPYFVLSYRLYDMQVKQFLDLGDSPDGDWYGQVLVGVDPVITVEETLDASGYWAETPEFTEFYGWDSCAVEFDAIQFNGQSLLAYAIDYDFNRSTTDDRDVYVLAYNFNDNSMTHPIMITNTDAAESNVEFRDVDGKLCLSYLSDGQEITFNISDNFSNANVLKKGVTDDGVFYYYISKRADSGYIPATVVAFNISYLDKDGQEQICEKCTSVGTGTAWTSGWYYVGSDITISNRITVTGDVHLILGDGATLSATKGITVETDNSLTIYAQSTGENMGKLVAGSQSENAAIGGASAAGGNITINGGDIQATGGYSAAGIGGGYYHDGGNIVIKGGTVTAIGGDYAAGIGGGAFADGGNITISGGTVTANGGPAAAGIGGGGGGNGGNITISGGIVNATGGKWGAGIGGGTNMGANIIVVYTSDPNRVKATAGSDADNYGDGKVSYDCYQVTFDSNGGSGDMGFLYISKNYTYAFPECRFTAPDGKQFKAWDIGGTEYAPGADLKVSRDTTVTAIWENIPAAKHTVSFAANEGSGSMTPVEVEDGTEYTLPACTFTAPSNKTFKAWSVGGDEKQPGDKITISADTTVAAVWEILHTCSITPVEKVWPSCENGGKEAYYKCEGCGKFFEDANGTTEIANIETWGIIDKLGHAISGWKKDGTHHWKTCARTICAVVIEGTKGEHTSTGNNVATCTKLAKCDICGVSYGDFAGHDWNTASWEKDATGHWHKCNTAGCTEKSDFAQHTPDRAAATETDPVKCSVCEYEITPALGHTHAIEPVEKVWPDCENGGKEAYYKCEGCGKFFEDANSTTEIADIATWGNLPKNDHDWNTASWEKDATGHWHKCNAAGCTEKSDFAQHTPDRAAATETDPVKCSACGYEITAALGHTHAHGTEWKSDKDNHWNECACGDKANTAAHKDENTDGKCDVCAYNVGLPTTPDDGNKPSDNPQTGDNTQPGLWFALMLISVCGLVVVSFLGTQKKGKYAR